MYFFNSQTIADYAAAVEKMNSGNYAEALEIFLTLAGYKDSIALADQCTSLKFEADCNSAVELMASGDYAGAYKLLCHMTDYKDASSLLEQCIANGGEQYYFTVTSNSTYGFTLNGTGKPLIFPFQMLKSM